MITLSQLNHRGYQLTPELTKNGETFLTKLNLFLADFPGEIIVTSGYRSVEDQIRIYQSSGKKPPMKSAHLFCRAVDLSDRDRQLKEYCMANLDKLAQCGLYIEDPTCTRNWLHFQDIAPASGRRVFLP